MDKESHPTGHCGYDALATCFRYNRPQISFDRIMLTDAVAFDDTKSLQLLSYNLRMKYVKISVTFPSGQWVNEDRGLKVYIPTFLLISVIMMQ